MTPNQLRAVTRIHQQEGIPKREAMRRVASQIAAAKARMVESPARSPASNADLAVCRGGCPEHSTEPAESCWLGIAGRDNPNCLAGSEQLSRRRLGQLPPCDRQLAARASVSLSNRPTASIQNRMNLPNRQIPTQTLAPETWVTTARLVADTVRLCSHLPGDIDAVLGVARSGLLPATQVAVMLHRPLWSVGALQTDPAAIVPCGGGWRLYGGPPPRVPYEPRKLLIVDDTAYGGNAARNVHDLAHRRWPTATILNAAIYAHPQTLGLLDFAACSYAGPHYLEWNLFNTIHLDPTYHGGTGADLDGILCRDFSAEEDDDGPQYLAAMRTMPPLHRPNRLPVPLIATARLDRYRAETEAWLRRSGIRWLRLVMGPWATRAERDAGYPANIIARKVDAIRAAGVGLFVESDPHQAQAIRRGAGIPVLCPKLGKVL